MRLQMRQMFETRSHSWNQVGLARQLTGGAVKRARVEATILLVLLAGVLVVYAERRTLFGPGFDTPVSILAAVALIALAWQFARDVGRALSPVFYRRMSPATAGTVGFLVRLVFVIASTIVALRIAGLTPKQLALGGAFTAVVLGLAAQQTIGNLFAGTVLLSARPFRVGDRVRMQGGPLAGTVEGVVSSLGLLYTTLANGADQVMVPNSVVLNSAVVPLREPAGIDVLVRLQPGSTPSTVQRALDDQLTVPLRRPAGVSLEELEGHEVTVRVQALPLHPTDGPMLADEVLAAVRPLTSPQPAAA
ncbi:MAG TPA: mechanosensitive ion channel family protein [Solirubrobacteraceae bacterium]